jgi:SAM-dependent methyltransferase
VAFSDLFSRRRKDEPDSLDTGAAKAPVHSTKGLAKFIAGLNGRSSPVLLDLGPVTGSNVTFFGEQLGCKIIVEDLSKDIDRAVKEKSLPELPAHFAKRFAQETGSVDGVLCWDVFDYLDKASAVALAKQLVRLLRPDGVLLAFFNTHEPKEPVAALYTKHVVVDKVSLQYRPYPAARGKQRPFQNRDIQRMFEPLRITDQFLLKSHMREVLFRKTGDSTGGLTES